MIDEDLNEEELNDDDVKEVDSFKTDKIFDNQFEQTELDTSEKSFQVDSNFVEKTFDEKVDEAMISDRIKELLFSNPVTNRFNIKTDEGVFPKINKSDINEIYRYILESIPGVPIIEAFSVITTVYDISPEKFYESLSNTFKTDLISELKNRGYLLNRKSLF